MCSIPRAGEGVLDEARRKRLEEEEIRLAVENDGEKEREGWRLERLEQRGIPRDVLMVLEIENAPGEPKWVWPPSLIVSVG